jgi:multidrug resistance efflux pump
MKLTKGKKIALISFAVFLAFMAICTVVAKGIYASKLPRVSTTKPYSSSLTHVIEADAIVKQGQEYGIYAEPGLRVDTVSVSRGDIFQAGDALFRIETGDLADTIAQRRLDIAKLKVQQAEAVKVSSHDRKEQQSDTVRAKQDYQKKVEAADARIVECERELEAARQELALYDQYLAESAEAAKKDETQNPDSSGGESKPPEGSGDGNKPSDGSGNKPSEGDGSENKPPEGDGSGNKPSEGDGSENKPPEGDGNGNKPSEGDGSGSKPSEGDGSGNKPSEGDGSENKPPEGDGSGNKPSEGDGSGNKPSEGDESENKPSEGDGSGNKPSEGDGSGNKSSEEDGSESQPPESSESKSSLTEVADQVPDYEQRYTQQEKRLQLEQKILACEQALEEAKRQKDSELLEAARLIEDAASVLDPDVSAVNLLSLDITYQEERLLELEALLEADGWVYAKTAGRVVDCSLAAGERVPDSAGILYALDDGERVLSAVFTEEQSKYISVGTPLEAKMTMPDGSKASGTALVEDQEKDSEGNTNVKLSFEGLETVIGQTVQLSYRMQTDTYSVCIPVTSLYQESEDSYYVFIAEEQEGILGTEWKVKKINVKVLDQTDSAAAIESVDISSDSRVVSTTTQPLLNGATVRVIQ